MYNTNNKDYFKGILRTFMKWFLIQNNEHLGPFSEETLDELQRKGEITANDLIWTEGWDRPKPLHEALSENSTEFEVLGDVSEVINFEVEEAVIKAEEIPPDLPPELPIEIKNHYKEKQKILAVSKVEIEEDIEEFDEQDIDESDDEVEIDFKEFEFEYEKNEKSILRKLQVLAIAFIIIVIAIPTFFYIKSQNKTLNRPESMSMVDYERLKLVASDFRRELQFAVALAPDKKTLWISTNLPLSGEIFLTMKSKQGRTLGENVELKAKGLLKDNLIEINNFQFVLGSKIVDGHYDLEIYTVDDLGTPFYQRFFESRPKQIRYINQFLVTSLKAKDFEKQLSLLHGEKNLNSSAFWKELLEKYRTVKFIAVKIRSALAKSFGPSEVSFNDKVNQFESDYKKQFGVFFTSFVQLNEKSYEQVVKKNYADKIDIMAGFSNLSELAVDIGEASMGALEKLRAYDSDNGSPENLKELQADVLFDFDRIIRQCDRKISNINIVP